jgi:tetratricopeptide (TPR) repeat protein
MDSAALSKAAEYLRRAKRLDPERIEVRQRLTKVLALLPESPETREEFLWLSDHYRNQRDLVRARQQVEFLIGLQCGQDPDVRQRLAELHLEAGDRATAAATYSEIAGQYDSLGQLAQAQQALERALEIHPEQTDLRKRLIELHEKSGQREQVLSERLSLLESLLAQGQNEEARAECRRLVSVVRTKPAHAGKLAQLCIRLGEHGIAYTLHMVMARQAAEENKTDEALKACRQAQAAQPEEPASYELQVELLLKSDNSREAVAQLRELAAVHQRKRATTKQIETLRRILQLLPEDVSIREDLIACLGRQGEQEPLLKERVALARLHRKAGRMEQALQQYQQVLERKPLQFALILEAVDVHAEMAGLSTALDFCVDQARILDRLGARPEAEKLLLHALQKDENFIPARVTLADLYRELGRTQATIEQMEILVQNATGKGNIEEATEWLNQVIQIDPRRTEPRRRMAQLHLQNKQPAMAAEVWIQASQRQADDGRLSEAESLLNEACENLPGEGRLQQALIRFYLDNQRFEDASRQRCHLAEMFLKEGNSDAAIQELNEALTHAPDPVEVMERLTALYQEVGLVQGQIEILRRLALQYQRQHRLAELVETCERVLRLMPGEVDTLRQLSETLFSMEEIEKACLISAELGQVHQDAGRFREAVEVYRRILKNQPGQVEVRRSLIESLIGCGSEEEAVREMAGLSRQLMTDGNTEEALELYDRALTLRERDPHLLRDYADALKSSGRSEQALSRYLELADLYEQNQMPERAVESLKAAEGLAPENTSISLRLAELFYQEGAKHSAVELLAGLARRLKAESKPAQAREILSRLVEMDSMNLPGRMQLAEILEQQGQSEQASVEYLRIAGVYVEQGEYAKAEQALAQAEKIPAEEEKEKERLVEIIEQRLRHSAQQTRLRQAEQLVQSGQLDRARQSYQTLLEDYPDNMEATLGLARLHLQSGEQDKARTLFVEAAEKLRTDGQLRRAGEVLEKILEFEPDFLPALERLEEIHEASGNKERTCGICLQMSELREKQGRFDLAVELCEKVLTLDRTQTEARERLGRLLRSLGRHEEAYQHQLALGEVYRERVLNEKAVEAFQQAAGILPNDARCRTKLASVYAELGRREEQIEETLKAAEIFWSGGHRQEARRLLTGALEIDARHIGARRLAIRMADESQDSAESIAQRKQLAAICLDKHQPRRAISIYREILEIDKEDIVTHRSLAEQLIKEGQNEEASQEYQVIGDVYNKRGISGKAINFYRKAQEYHPQPDSISEKIVQTLLRENLQDKAVNELLALAETYQQKNQVEDMLRAYDQVLDIDPGNLRVLNRVAQAQAQAQNPDGAARAYRQIVETYVERGILGKAIEACRKGLELARHDISLRERLADLLVKKGELKEARKEYKLLQEFSPDDFRIPQIIGRLDRQISGEKKPAAPPRPKREADRRAASSQVFGDPYAGFMDAPAVEAITSRGEEGLNYFRRKRYTQAIDELTAAVNLWKKNPTPAVNVLEYFNALGESYLGIESAQAAVQVLHQGIASVEGASDEDLLDLRYTLGRAYEMLGQNEDALKLWKAVYRINTKYKDVANKILWSRVSRKK